MALRHDLNLLLLTLAAGLPAVALALVLLWIGPHSARIDWTLTVIVVGCWLGLAEAVRGRASFPLQTISNLLAALREGDFSLRARGAQHDDPLGEVLFEVNLLGATLRAQRLGAMEAAALLQKVMAEVDVAVFAFDADQNLRLVNRAGERLLGAPAPALLGRAAAACGLETCLAGEAARMLHLQFPGGGGRWELRRGSFREEGRTHQLLLLTDVSRALREEERQAWQRLIRVLGHELNNSMAPIHSLAESLAALLARRPLPADWREDMSQGLGVIASRAEALNRFMSAYTRWAKLPRPRFQSCLLPPLVHRAAQLETRVEVAVEAGGPRDDGRDDNLLITADPDQIEQALINLVKNAADAAIDTGGGVRVRWRPANGHVDIAIEDDGPGLPASNNLFVPFFTTKPGGSGIGLLVSRQIAEAHGGSLVLENRRHGHGCEAHLRLPLAPGSTAR